MPDTGCKSVGTSTVQLGNSTVAVERGVELKAKSDNASTAFVGFRSTITADTVATTAGYPLAAGESIFVSPKACGGNMGGIYLIADGAAQQVFWINT